MWTASSPCKSNKNLAELQVATQCTDRSGMKRVVDDESLLAAMHPLQALLHRARIKTVWVRQAQMVEALAASSSKSERSSSQRFCAADSLSASDAAEGTELGSLLAAPSVGAAALPG